MPGYGRREEIGGPLARVIETAWNVVREEMRVGAVVKGLEREELTEYPLFAVREALVNAVCHRDYRLKGRRIEDRMFSDRMEVISPGGLPGFITVDNLVEEHFAQSAFGLGPVPVGVHRRVGPGHRSHDRRDDAGRARAASV